MSDKKPKVEKVEEKFCGKILVRCSSFMFEGEVKEAKFCEKAKRHYFEIKKDDSKAFYDQVKRKEFKA